MRFANAMMLGVSFLSVRALVDVPTVQGANWVFGNNANGLTNFTTKTLPPNATFALQLSVHNPAAARFFEGDTAGLTVNSSGLVGISDLEGADKINLIDVNGVLAAESVAFSFDKPGVLTGIDFDGVKDESLEYFIVTSSGGLRINFFDSFANTSIPGAVDDAIADGHITGDVVYLLEMGLFDDEAAGLHIPFAAGQQFVVTYAELPPVAHDLYEPGNGARLQGITVETVPEPSTLLLTFAVVLISVTSSMFRPRVRR